MSKLLQEQIDQLRQEIGFLARHVTCQQAVMQDLLARTTPAAAPSGKAIQNDADADNPGPRLCERVAGQPRPVTPHYGNEHHEDGTDTLCSAP